MKITINIFAVIGFLVVVAGAVLFARVQAELAGFNPVFILRSVPGPRSDAKYRR